MLDYKKMVVFFQTTSKNGGGSGAARVEAGRVFNFDGFGQNLNAEQVELLSSLPVSGEFMPVPEELLDYTTAQNFACAIALATPADFIPVEVLDI